MKSKIISVLLLFTMLVSFAVPCSVSAEESVTTPPTIRVLLNGTELKFDVPPQIIDGRTMVPMRVIFEALGATVEWDEVTKTVTAMKDNIGMRLRIGSPNMAVVKMNIDSSGKVINAENPEIKAITLDVPPQIVNSRTLVPVRAIAECFGAEVTWDEKSKTVTITSKKVVEEGALLTPSYADSNYVFYDTPNMSKLLCSVKKDWYITVDGSYHTKLTSDGNNVFNKGDMDIMYVKITDVSKDKSFQLKDYVQQQFNDRIGTAGNSSAKSISQTDINELDYFLFGVKTQISGTDIYWYTYFTFWDNKVFEFSSSSFQRTSSRYILSMLLSFNPKSEKSKTEQFISSYLSDAVLAEKAAVKLILSDTNTPYVYTKSTKTTPHMLNAVAKDWSITIDNTYAMQEAKNGSNIFQKADTDYIFVMMHQNNGTEKSLSELASYLLKSQMEKAVEDQQDVSIVKDVAAQTIGQREYQTFTYKNIVTTSDSETFTEYYTSYLTEYNGTIFEFLCMGETPAPSDAFLKTVTSFQPKQVG